MERAILVDYPTVVVDKESRVYAGVFATDRTMRLLELLVGSSDGLTVSELSNELGVEKSIVSRILASLNNSGYVRYIPSTRRYGLSLKFVALAYRHVDIIGFPDVVMPILRRLSDQTGDLVMLGVVGEEGVVLFAKAEPKYELRVVSRLGRPVPPHASSAAKIWLASLPVEQALRIVSQAGMPPLAPNTITSIEDFATELHVTRKRGYATSLEERFPGVNTIAVPVKGRNTSSVVGCIVLSGPVTRLTVPAMQEFLPLLNEAAIEMSRVWPLPEIYLEPDRLETFNS
jgi:IclR family transcriptional regulator, acetate operon repressor